MVSIFFVSWRGRLADLTKTELKNCKNTQNKSLDGEHCKEKLCREIGERFE